MKYFSQLRQGRCCLLPALVVLALIFLTRLLWLPALSNFLVVADPLQPADAIVPLAGGVERAQHAAGLFQQGYAGSFVVTDNSIALHSLAQPELSITGIATAAGVPAPRLHPIATTVTSTYEEALAVRTLAEEQGWQSLIVVTSPAHTRRSRMIFHEVFADTGISIIIRPVMDKIDESEEWWQMKQKRKLVLNEYLKLGAFLVGIR
jgi:uncharacterized SAM-binding protein YcdF (DUF218 family)